MGYQIKCDGYLLHDLRLYDEKLIVQNPKCTLEVNTVGTASFLILSEHPNYGVMKKMRSIFEILQDGEPIFRGRMTGDTRDFDNTKFVDLEGVLAFFNDSVVRPFVFPGDFLEDAGYISAAESGNVVQFFLKWLIDRHNEQVKDWQKLKLGRVTVRDPNNYISRESEEYLSTWEVIKTRLFDSSLGGYLCIRYEADGNYVDYLSDFEFTNSQSIEYGENLLDLSCESDASATYSAIIPLGADTETEISKGTVEGEYVDFELTETVKEKTNISKLPDGDITSDIVKRGDTLYSKSAVEQYGWIYAPTSETTWDDITEAENLKSKGVEYLSKTAIMLTNTITIQAFDLHFSDEEIESFRIYGYVPLLSKPHDQEDSLKLTKLDIDIQNPQNTVITLGEIRLSLTDINAGIKRNNQQRIENVIKIVSDSVKQAVSKVIVYYYLSESESELVGGEWSETPPEWVEGRFYWQMMIAVHTDGTIKESDPVCVSGKNGTNGTGILSIVEQYYRSVSSTSLRGGSWSADPPEWVDGEYVWTRSVITYTNDTVVTTAAVCVSGAKGSSGANGISISSVDVWYYLSMSSSALFGGSWATTAPTWRDGFYMWSKTVTTYSNSTSSETNPVCITGARGSNGVDGSDGSDGVDGVGVSGITTIFYLSTSKTEQIGGSWVETMPEWSTGYYLWTRSVVTYTDGSTEYTEPICDSSWEVANEVKAELQEEFTSKFEQFSNEITLEITGSLGSTASIVMTAGGVEHKDELELSAIRQAFANDDTAVEISAGLITFNSGTIVINSNNFTLDSTGKITATGAQINGNITTVDGNYKTHFDNGSVELYFKDGFCGSINTKDRYDVNRGGIVLTVENDGRYIEFNTFQNNTFRTHYVMNAGYFEGDEAQNKFVHHFYSTAKFYHTVHFVGEGAFCSSLCMQNNAFIKSYNHSTGKIGEEMLGYDGTYVNVGSTGGLTMLRGKTVYLKDTSTTVTSDRNAKNSIESLPDAYEAFFDNLEPVRFKYNEGVSGRYHVGYIAQDVETALGKAGLSSMDFAGFVDVGFSGELGLTYDEFIAVLHKKIKRLESRIAELENRKESESS